ncbi:MAG TPA: hypothetical protein VFV50_15975 [Bdellovibrionales bacterium]|nr:hypothetical protein [Bdellovibrionales bacterium]
MIGAIRSSAAAAISEYKRVDAEGEQGISVDLTGEDNPAYVVNISREALEALARSQNQPAQEES